MDADQPIELLRHHAGLIAKVAHAYCKSPSDREDVVQEIAVQLWRAWDRYDPRFAESTFVYRIALNVAISFHRRERRHRSRRESLDAHAITLAAPSTREPSEAVERLLRCIDGLPPLDKALVLLDLDDQDHATIADVLGLSVSNVGTKLHRIRARLRTTLALDGDAP
ncbi:MAG: sigma-70 family RNA polymerase sigma factor [Planctomycetes bacterium]|nr:sigma-70 family RNA polymerase sigma factor [Planctomycetota bacterium]